MKKRGVQLMGLRRPREAEADYLEAMGLLGGLAAGPGADPQDRADLASALTDLAVLRADVGRVAEAEGGLVEALALYRRLVAEFPTVVPYRANLARAQSDLALLLAREGYPGKAEPHFREAAAIFRRIVEDDPDQAAFRDRMAGSLINLGMVLWMTGRMPEAEAAYRECDALLGRLAADAPEVADYRTRRAAVLSNLGLALKDLPGRSRECEVVVARSIDLASGCLAEDPQSQEHRMYLAGSLGIRAILEMRAGRLDRAEVDARESLAIWEKLAGRPLPSPSIERRRPRPGRDSARS